VSSRISDHGELIFDVLRYATRMLAEGDEAGLLMMGFTPDQILGMEALTLKSLQRVGELSSHFLDFRIDPACFERVMRRIEQERLDEALKDDLLRAGAPIRMMHHFWGMTSRDCSERRRVLGVEAPIGRPAHADDPALERLWHLWQESSAIPDERMRYLELAKQSELSMSVIWIAVEEWKEEGGGTHVAPQANSSSRTEPRNPSRVVELHR
jgi:hypothetical protein